jgi:hypothetical protein
MKRGSVSLLAFLVAAGASGAGAAPRANDRAVRQEIQAIYARYIQANKAKDPGSFLQFLDQKVTPDFVATDLRGAHTRQQLMDELKGGQSWEPARSIRLHIDHLAVQGNEAIATVSGVAVRDSRNPKRTGDPSGKPHRFVTRTTRRDTWVKTPAGWKVKRDEELSVKLTRDGQPFTPPRPAAAGAEGEKKAP